MLVDLPRRLNNLFNQVEDKRMGFLLDIVPITIREGYDLTGHNIENVINEPICFVHIMIVSGFLSHLIIHIVSVDFNTDLP